MDISSEQSRTILETYNPGTGDFLVRCVSAYRGLFFGMMIGQLMWASGVAFRSFYMGEFMNGFENADRAFTFETNLTFFLPGIIGILITFLVSETGHIFKPILELKAYPALKAQIRKELFAYLHAQSYNFLVSRHVGELSGRVSLLAESVERFLDILMFNFLTSAMVMFISIAIVGFLHPFLMFLFLAWVLVTFSGVLLFGYQCYGNARLFARRKNVTQGNLIDSLVNHHLVKIFSNASYEEDRLHDYLIKEIHSDRGLRWKTQRAQWLLRFSHMFFQTAVSVCCVWFWYKRELEIGDVAFLFFAITLIVMNFWGTAQSVVSFLTELGIIRNCVSNLVEPVEIRDSPEAHDLHFSSKETPLISFNKAHFSYDRNNIIDNLTLSIPEGQKIGLIGPSGAGKTTLVSLLLRFYEPGSGQIMINGTPIPDVTQESLRKHIAVIPQDTSLFHRTLIENIRYGRLDATDEEVMDAAKKAHAHDFISGLSKGYETLVGERGVKLSGGQRQRIALARAILKNAPILILDEATSALDSESEKLIQESLNELMEGKTVIAIAHRLSTIAHLDRLIVMDKGRIIEDGPHDALLKTKNGLYARLWALQSDGFLGREPEET